MRSAVPTGAMAAATTTGSQSDVRECIVCLMPEPMLGTGNFVRTTVSRRTRFVRSLSTRAART
jgi:hypothetical protein